MSCVCIPWHFGHSFVAICGFEGFSEVISLSVAQHSADSGRYVCYFCMLLLCLLISECMGEWYRYTVTIVSMSLVFGAVVWCSLSLQLGGSVCTCCLRYIGGSRCQ